MDAMIVAMCGGLMMFISGGLLAASIDAETQLVRCLGSLVSLCTASFGMILSVVIVIL